MFDEARLPPHALMQDPAFARALQLCGQTPVMLPGGLTVLSRRFAGIAVNMLPRAAPPVDLAAQLREVELHRQPMILSPDTPCTMPRCLRVRGPRALAWLSLSQSKDENRAALHPKWRNQLRKAEASALKVRCHPLPPHPDTTVLALETKQAMTRGYRNWPAPLTAAFAAAVPAQTHLFSAYLKGQPIAHMLFLSHGSAASYHIGHIAPEGRSLSAHNLLMWSAITQLSARGIHQLDLGPLDPQTPDLNRFKLRAGARHHKTGGTSLMWYPLA